MMKLMHRVSSITIFDQFTMYAMYRYALYSFCSSRSSGGGFCNAFFKIHTEFLCTNLSKTFHEIAETKQNSMLGWCIACIASNNNLDIDQSIDRTCVISIKCEWNRGKIYRCWYIRCIRVNKNIYVIFPTENEWILQKWRQRLTHCFNLLLIFHSIHFDLLE